MTIRLITGGARPTDALASHAYSIPVVRELPLPLGEPVDDRTW